METGEQQEAKNMSGVSFGAPNLNQKPDELKYRQPEEDFTIPISENNQFDKKEVSNGKGNG